jgi:hypothetical protein
MKIKKNDKPTNKNTDSNIANCQEKGSNSYRKKPNWTEVTLALTAIIGVLATLAGLIFVYFQLKGLNVQIMQSVKQTTLLSESIKESYRPLALITHKYDQSKSNISITYLESSKPDKFSFIQESKIVNHGKGILRFVGYVYYISTEPLDFRKRILEGNLENVLVDGVDSLARDVIILPTESAEITPALFDIPFERNYYLYVIVFYKDIVGNLYDSLSLMRLYFVEPTINGNKLATRLDPDKGFRTTTYHSYTEEERGILIKLIQTKSPSLYDCIKER